MRKCGVLLPISSLPASYGIGTLGKAAYHFVDFLVMAGQSLWQILPVGPTGYGDSPYQSFSAFAGNPYFIDFTILVDEGLLLPGEIPKTWAQTPEQVDYSLLFEQRMPVLAKAVARQNKAEPAPLRTRQPAALQEAMALYGPRYEFWRCVQYWFWKQWNALKDYANKQGISIVGDTPIYISADSSDLWANPELFQVGDDGHLTCVAGVPPDAFSATGQLWGNPLYNWPYHKRTGYRWWLQRLRYTANLYDINRIDHFRGFAGYYAVPAGEKTAENGEWLPGPGKDFIRAVRRELPDIKLIAEDLGFLTQEVRDLLQYSTYPGMKVLQFAFDNRSENDYLPHNYGHNCVVYTGTHDNTTTEDWQKTASKSDVRYARRYLGLGQRQNLTDAMVRTALASVGETCIIPLQDWLHLGGEARINTPSTLGGNNWRWRLLPDALTPSLAQHMGETSALYGRIAPGGKQQNLAVLSSIQGSQEAGEIERETRESESQQQAEEAHV